jgi:intein/homing endonuclease
MPMLYDTDYTILKALKNVIKDLNGLLYNPTRIEQFKKICTLNNIEYIESRPLDFNSNYLAGLFDSDGSIYLNIKSQQVFITISQKSRVLLDIIANVYGGRVYSANANNTAFK